MKDVASDVALSRIRGHTAGGKDFNTSLTYHTLDTSRIGNFNYLPVGNFISYITQTKTGMIPQDYAAEKVFPLLGISEDDYTWYQNTEGVNLGFHGLNMNTRTLSKLPMLYMQRGLASETDRVITDDWIDRTFTAGDTSPDVDPFGYFYWVGIEPVYCTYGFLGQRACFNNETNRALAVFSETLFGVFGEEEPNAISQADTLVELFLQNEPSSLNSCAPKNSNEDPTVESSTNGSSASFLLMPAALFLMPIALSAMMA